jgi:nucleotide-binding universal stress UspA family protein
VIAPAESGHWCQEASGNFSVATDDCGHVRWPATVTKLPMSGSGPEEFAGLRGKLEQLAAECGLRAKVLSEVSPAPAAAIMATAEELGCDLIVLGTHGRSGLARAVLGSVAEGVVRGAPCPVVVMRAR